MQEERFEEKERRVLQLLLDQRKDHPHGFYPQEIARALNLDVNEVQEIVVELEAKGWADGGDETTWIVPAGIKELQKQPEIPTPHIVINNPQNSPMSFGDYSSQTVNYNNQSLNEVLPVIANLIEEVRHYDFVTRDEVIIELEKIQTLAKGNMNAGVWQLIQSRLLTTKTALEVGQIALQTLPYWPALWGHFFK